MTKVMIDGIATFTDKGFHFESGLPSNSPILDQALTMRGTLKMSENACADFTEDTRTYLPPENHTIAKGEGYHVRRTTRHYLIQLKVPVMEKRSTTEQRLHETLPFVLGDITTDRQELMEG